MKKVITNQIVAYNNGVEDSKTKLLYHVVVISCTAHLTSISMLKSTLAAVKLNVELLRFF